MNTNIALIEMMYKTNVIVLVYENQRNKVVIWDDHEKKNRTEITFNANQLIMNVKLRKDMMIVVAATVVLHESLTLVQIVAFSGSLGGIAVYSAMKVFPLWFEHPRQS